jgi:TorA maturation chaperone TorD
MESARITLVHRIEPEDETRARFYALLGRLYARGPDAPLLAALAGSPAWPDHGGDGGLGAAWNKLILASRAMDADAAAQEFTEMFIGVGKSPVNLHASHWIAGFMMEKPLAELRGSLAELGLARRPGADVLEDQLAALCETMRILIAGEGEREPATVAVQRAFFERHIASWVFDCCNAIRDCPLANYYRRVAEFTIVLMTVERDSLAIA